jgi:NAD-dependent dihydropyrimidine dehydrogenase PreA subunit
MTRRCLLQQQGSSVMSYTIDSNVCEGSAECFNVCPVNCIHWAEGKTNKKSLKFAYIDEKTCIDCGACLAACPVVARGDAAIIDTWKPELQMVKHSDYKSAA